MQVITGIPAVSIITATRGRPEWLCLALRSIAQQTLTSFESIVVDDGSEAVVLEQYQSMQAELGPRFRFYLPKVPGLSGTGPSRARNRGVSQARGQFITFLDDDDHWIAPDHLAVAVQHLEQQKADFYFSNMQGESHGKVAIADWFPDSPWLRRGPRISSEPMVFQVGLKDMARTMHHHYPHLNGCVVRRSLLQKVGWLWEPLGFAEDFNWVLRLLDQAQGVLYRADPVVGFNVTPRDSAFARTSKTERFLQGIQACAHVRATCTHGCIRRCARACEAWYMRQAAAQLSMEKRRNPALNFAWQALCLYPSAGALLQLMRCLKG